MSATSTSRGKRGERRPLVAAVAACVSLSMACAPTTQDAKVKSELRQVEKEATADKLQARGEASATVGDMTRAEQYFVAALKAGGDDKELTKRLLVVCVTDGRYPVALEYAEDYLRKHPGDVDVRYAQATLYAAMGDRTHARDGLEKVVTAKPEMADAHYALATVLREDDMLLQADEHYREYLRLSPNGPYAEAARALLLKSVR